jgi:hypothetical protein
LPSYRIICGKVAGGNWMKVKLKNLLGVKFIFIRNGRNLPFMEERYWGIEWNKMDSIRGGLFSSSNIVNPVEMSGPINPDGPKR